MPGRSVCVFGVLGFLATTFAPAGGLTAPATDAWIQSSLNDLIEVYRHFHTHPELSFHERETANRLASEWRSVGAEVTSRVGGHGVVALIKNGDGPTLMLRTDLDALPVMEQTGLSFASQVRVKTVSGAETGVMHACGHDVHITNLIGVARYMASRRDLWCGTLMLIGQPAEERGAGAAAMLQDGLFERFPRPVFAVALHVDGTMATGRVSYRAGHVLANVDSVDITIRGIGGHGAQPHTTIDPIVQAAQLIMSLQTIVSREVKPIEPAVITVGSIHGGTKHNIIGNTCELQLTVRSYSDEVRRQLLDGIKRRTQAVAMGARAPEPVVTFSDGTPSLRNSDELASRLGKVFRHVLGDEKVDAAERSMGGEDFSRYGRAGVPILMYRLGAVDQQRLDSYRQQGQEPPSLHSPLFYPDIEKTLATGLKTMVAVALELLNRKD